MVGETWYADPDDLAAQPVGEFTFGYNLRDEITAGSDANFSSSYAYGGTGQVVDRTVDIAGLQAAVGSIRMESHYDLAGNRDQVVTSIGSSVDNVQGYVFDTLNRMTAVTQQAQAGGHAVAPKHVTLAYDLAGQFDRVTRYISTSTAGTPVATTDFTFDKTGRVDLIKHYKGQSTGKMDHLNGYDLGWDRAHRLTQFMVTSPLYSSESVTQYSYNARDELVGADYVQDAYNEGYQYDVNGNRESVTRGGETLQYEVPRYPTTTSCWEMTTSRTSTTGREIAHGGTTTIPTRIPYTPGTIGTAWSR